LFGTILDDLQSKCFVADLEETWERERTATPVRGVPFNFMRPVVHSEKQFWFLLNLA